MKDKVKKVLSYIGVACLGAFLGMGALIGVSSCSKQDNQQQLKAKVDKKELLTSQNQESLYVIREDISTSNTYTAGLDMAQELFNDHSDVEVRINFYGTFTTSTYDGEYWSLGFYLNCHYNNGRPNFSITRIYMNNSQDSDAIWYNNTFYNNNAIVVEFSRWVSTDSNVSITNWTNFLENFFYKFYNGNNVSFSFAKQINYYAPYLSDISNYYVNDNTMASGVSIRKITYDLPYFISGGFLFNRIEVLYNNAISTSYLDSNGDRQVWGNNGFATYHSIIYVNTANNQSKVVNQRNLIPWSSGSSSGYNQGKGSYWVSNDFQNLLFARDLTPQERLDINQFNNNQFGDSFTIVQDADIGLGNVFSLISMAFSSWLPILSTTIVPGISIGLLLFLPLIAGIIIFIIWIVKR